MNYCLKDARPTDKAFIYGTKKESLKKYIEAVWGWNERLQRDDFDRDFAMLDNFKTIWLEDRAVGYLETNESGRDVNITEIHIVPWAQGKGIGSAIVSGIMRDAKEQGKRVTLGCFKANSGALRLYQTLGFNIIGVTETHFLLAYM